MKNDKSHYLSYDVSDYHMVLPSGQEPQSLIEGLNMVSKRKNKSNTPRHKRLNRSARLDAAKHWIPTYEGQHLVKGYSRHFGVDKLCAVKELEMPGYSTKFSYKKQLQETVHRKQRNTGPQHKETGDEQSNGTFAYIAGDTPGGAPYGITWEKLDEDE